MSQEIETMYDNFLSQLKQKLGPVDPIFAIRLMYLERKMTKSYHPTMKPHVALTITYNPEVDLEAKRAGLQSKGGLMVDLFDNPKEILCMGCMNIQDVQELSVDSDNKNITGKASPVLRA